MSPFFLFILNRSAKHTLLTVRLASTSFSLNGSFDFSPCHVVFDHSSPQRMCDPPSSQESSARVCTIVTAPPTSTVCTQPSMDAHTAPLSALSGTSPEALPLRGKYGKQPAQRAVATGATQSGGPQPGRPGRHRGPRSWERRLGQRRPLRAGKGAEGGAVRAAAGPGTGSAPRVSLSSAPAAALPQPPPSCRDLRPRG